MGALLFALPGWEWSDWSSELRIPGDELKWKFISDGPMNGWGWRFTVYPIKPAVGPSIPLDVLSASNSSTQLMVKWNPPSLPSSSLSSYIMQWWHQPQDSCLHCKTTAPKTKSPSGSMLMAPSMARRLRRISRPNCGGKKGQCCTCPITKAEKQAEKEEAEDCKVFKNSLHNIIFMPSTCPLRMTSGRVWCFLTTLVFCRSAALRPKRKQREVMQATSTTISS
ncbi:Insulin-like growth factor 1 receptor [Camelus dromedarius]|uniref:Insulin-like growth factor 1 receptor n=1 Tax=Camelus dromedarius TaxID=9838 RepID=A0A5N4C0F1_CAMDR|nr:Insulin-like growth factor 1 receptor [Camelus dromedarius]